MERMREVMLWAMRGVRVLIGKKLGECFLYVWTVNLEPEPAVQYTLLLSQPLDHPNDQNFQNRNNVNLRFWVQTASTGAVIRKEK